MLMSSLRSQIQQLAVRFVDDVLAAVASASLGELSQLPSGPSARPSPAPARRSRRRPRERRFEHGATVDKIVAALRGAGAKGMRSEHLQAAVGMTSDELHRPLVEALATDRIVKRGQRRGTTYFVR